LLYGTAEAVPFHLRISRPREREGPLFSRKIRVEYEADGQRHPAPLKWLDSFAMRNFTNAPIFDDTLPVADGLIEVGARVPLPELKSAMEEWFRRKGYLAKDATLALSES
jgi:hypothetical protein